MRCMNRQKLRCISLSVEDKDSTFQVKRKQVVDDDPSADLQDQMDESSPEWKEATFSKMLRDV